KLYALDKAEIEKRGIDLTRQEELANELEKEFAAKSDFFAQVSGRKTITWKDIQARLKPGEAAVEIIRFNPYQSDTIGSSVYIALILSPQTKAFPSGLSLGTDKELEGKSFSYFINSVKHKLKDENSYAKYWAPLKAGLEKEGAISKVYLSADGVYNKISMNALQNPASGQFLSDEIDIHLVSNTKILAEKKTSLVAKNKRCELYGFPDYSSSVATGAEEIPVVAANRNTIDTLSRYFKGGVIADLPATETEVKEISGILKGKGMDAQIYLRKEASEERLKNTESPLVLHIATHGFFMKDEEAGLQNGKALSGDVLKLQQNPLLRSGLLLAGVANSFKQKNNENYFAREDGMFTAYEAMNLDLSKTELVVLSACETGLGEIRNGEGVYGLQRALEISGARAILMSLWTVNDEATRELMVEFYKGWMETGNKREAFKKAQQKLKEKYKDPYYWAAFVLMGE
ncbi:MAG: CHAT domain-containing protein, partial [Cytophagaceae bacterium]